MVCWGSLHHPSVGVLPPNPVLLRLPFSTAVVEAASSYVSREAAERSCPGAGGFSPFAL